MAVIRRRVRSRPIRLLLIGMFAVPLVSVIGLWAFLTSITVTSAVNNHNFNSASRGFISSGALLSLGLTGEREQTYLWLVTDRKTAESSLLAARKTVTESLSGAMASDSSGALPLSPAAESAMHSWYSDLRQLTAIRAAVDSGAMSPSDAFMAYTGIIDAEFHFYYSSIQDTGGLLAQPSIGTSDAAYTLEMANRETVLVDGALASSGSLSAAAQQEFAGAAASRRLLMNQVITLLPPSMSAAYVSIENSAPYQRFQAMENQITSSIGSGGRIPVNPAAWQSASQAYLASMVTAELNSGTQLGTKAASLSDTSLREAILAGGIGLAAVLASVLLLAWLGRKLTRDLKDLDGSVRSMADERLPRVVERLRRGDDVDALAESPPPPTSTVREISQIAGSFAIVQESAVTAAVDQARLRKGVSQVFLNISMRNQSLLHRQLSMLDSMERRTSEPGALAELFRLDHLTTRMRRHAEGLVILSGSTPARGWRNPIPVVDVMRAAVAEVEDYIRVDVVSESLDLIAGSAVNDVIHLFAELIENATVFSPPSTRIEVRADRVGIGLAVEIEDRGLGMSEEELAEINSRLATPSEFDLANSDQLGLFVAGRLAARHAIRVTLRRSAFGGTTAILLLPFGVIVRAEDASLAVAPGSQDDQPMVDDAGGLAAVGVRGRAALTGQPDSSPNGAEKPSLFGPGGRLHRLRAAATGRRGDTSPTGVAGPAEAGAAGATGTGETAGTSAAAETAAAIGGIGATWVTGEQPRLPAVRELPSQSWSPWREAFQPRTVQPRTVQPRMVRQEAPAQGGPEDTDPGQPLTTPGFSLPGPGDARPASPGSHLGMPIRVPQASLAPQLRVPGDTDSRPATLGAPVDTERSPEATRDMLILMQDGWKRGRLDDVDEPDSAPGKGNG